MSSSKYKFVKLKLNRKKKIYKNISFLPKIISCIKPYTKFLCDDFAPKSDIVELVLSQIEKSSGYFWVILSEKEDFLGIVYLENFVGNKKQIFSAEITTCFEKRFWGKETKKCGKKFIKYCFNKLNIKKLKAIVYKENFRVKTLIKILGFQREAFLRAETKCNEKLQDIEIYSIFNERT